MRESDSGRRGMRRRAALLALLWSLAGAPCFAGNPVVVWNQTLIQGVRQEMPPPCLARDCLR